MFFARRMLQITPNAKYADAMEQALYNTVLSGMALDGKSFFYVNPLEVVPEACHKDERKFHVKTVRQKWFGCACCPPNLARTLSSIGNYAYTEKDDTLFVHLYMGSTVEKEIAGETAEIQIRSGFPWNGDVSVKVSGCEKRFTIALRLPGWAREYTLKLSESGRETASGTFENTAAQAPGVSGSDTAIYSKDGYLYITKAWAREDELVLDFPMEINILQADSRIREDYGKVALMRGPVVYCLEEADNGKDLHLLSADLTAEPKLTEQTISDLSVKGITLSGTRTEPVYIDGRMPYRLVKKRDKKPATLTFIPYFTWANRGENEMSVWVRADGSGM